MSFPATQPQQFHTNSQSKSVLDKTNKVQGRWTKYQHNLFLDAIIRFGKEWRKVEGATQNRTSAQVRSHAQKFFLKINNVIKDRKKKKGKKIANITDIENELKEYFAMNPLTQETPLEIIELLKIEKVGIKEILMENCNGGKEKKQQLKQFLARNFKTEKKKSLEKNIQPQNIPAKSNADCPIGDQNFHLHIAKAIMKQAIIRQMQDVQDEDSSFLGSIVRKNLDYFKNGGQFTGLIDFGGSEALKSRKIEEESETCTGFRKGSFTAY